MSLLNLSKDSLEDIGGKIIEFNECKYQIGSLIESNESSISYKLLNSTSGLCLYYVKFWRNNLIRDYLSKSIFRSFESEVGSLFDELLPNNNRNSIQDNREIFHMDIQAHGGSFEIGFYNGPFEEPSNKTFELVQMGKGTLKNSDFDSAIYYLYDALQINKFHTEALYYLSVACRQINDLKAALQNITTALNIEPNFLPYQKAYIIYTYNLGQVRTSLEKFQYMKYQYKNYDLDDYGIELFLSSGEPEKAKELMDSSKKFLEDTELKRRIDDEINIKIKSMSLYDQAKSIIYAKNLDGITQILEKAYSIYKRNPLITINYALALQREGKYQQAKDLLLYGYHIFSVSKVKICLANIVFGELIQTNYEEAIKYIPALKLFTEWDFEIQKSNDSELLPSKTIWIDEDKVIEEPIDVAYDLFKGILNNYSDGLPDDIIKLINLYKESFARSKNEGLEQSSYDMWLSKGNELYNREQYDDAVDCYNLAINASPNDWEAYYNKSLALYRLEREQEAIDIFYIAVKINPELPNLLKMR